MRDLLLELRRSATTPPVPVNQPAGKAGALSTHGTAEGAPGEDTDEPHHRITELGVFLQSHGLRGLDRINIEVSGHLLHGTVEHHGSQPTAILVNEDGQVALKAMDLAFENWQVLLLDDSQSIEEFVQQNSETFGELK